MLLHQLVDAGCTFGPNDLTLDEWLGLGALKAALAMDAAETAKQRRQGQVENPTLLQITPGH